MAVNQAQAKSLLTSFQSLDVNKLEINDVTQFCLIKKLIETKGKDYECFLPPLVVEYLKNENDGFYDHLNILFTNSTKEEVDYSTVELMNYFLSRKYSEKILDISNKDISSLVSHVKFLRIPKDGHKPLFNKATEINFSTRYSKNSFDSILRDSTACGLTSLSAKVISNTGAYFAYNITMNLYFANASILVENPKYKLLLTAPTKDDNKNAVVYSLVLGWANPTNTEQNNAQDLYDENLCLLLNLKKYELGFQADGGVTLTLDFIGAAERDKEPASANILINKFENDSRVQTMNAEVAKQKEELKSRKERVDTYVNMNKTKLAAEEANRNKNPEQYDKDPENKSKIENLQKELTDEGLIQKEENVQINRLERQIKDREDALANLKYTSFLTEVFRYNRVYQGFAEFSVSGESTTEIGKRGETDLTNLGKPKTEISFRASADLRTNQEKYLTKGSVGLEDNLGLMGQSTNNVTHAIRRARKENEERKDTFSASERELIDMFTDHSYSGDSTPEAIEQRAKENASKGADAAPILYGKIAFCYFFVGDIIAIAAENAYSNLLESYGNNMDTVVQNLGIVLTTLDLSKTIYDKTKLDETGSPSADEQIITVDLAKIPISYNYFTSWFHKNVVSKQRETYPLGSFLKDFLQDCVLKVIQKYSDWEAKYKEQGLIIPSETAIVKTFSDETIEIAHTDLPYNLRAKNSGTEILPHEIRNLFKGNSTRKQISPFVASSDVGRDIFKYTFAYGKFGKLKRSGNFQENLRDGIFHFYVGSTTGILKDIKFNPINSPQRLAVQIQSASATKEAGKPLDEKFNIIQRYDVNITCVGCQYFKPGQIIFVDTSLLGFGKPSDANSISRQFTLGGYYLITDVSHDFEGNDFTTSITAKFTDYGGKK